MVSFKANTFSPTGFILANGTYRCKSAAFAVYKETMSMSKLVVVTITGLNIVYLAMAVNYNDGFKEVLKCWQ